MIRADNVDYFLFMILVLRMVLGIIGAEQTSCCLDILGGGIIFILSWR